MFVPAPWPGTLSSTQTFKQVVYLWAAGPGALSTKALSNSNPQSGVGCQLLSRSAGLPEALQVLVGLEPAETTW